MHEIHASPVGFAPTWHPVLICNNLASRSGIGGGGVAQMRPMAEDVCPELAVLDASARDRRQAVSSSIATSIRDAQMAVREDPVDVLATQRSFDALLQSLEEAAAEIWAMEEHSTKQKLQAQANWFGAQAS